MFLVSAFLPEVTQQIHSFRASGVISSHSFFTPAEEAIDLRKSDGSVCGVLEVVMVIIIIAQLNFSPVSQIIARRHSQFSRPRLVVSSVDETSLRLHKTPADKAVCLLSAFCDLTGSPATKIFSSKNFVWAPPRDFSKRKITLWRSIPRRRRSSSPACAQNFSEICDLTGNRTPIDGLRTRCPNR